MKLFAMMCTSALLAGCTASTSTDLEQRVDELYDRMSQEERIAQLRSMYMDELFDDDGQLDTAKCRELIPNGIGHFSQFCMQKPRDPNDLRNRVAAVQNWLIENTPNGIPALMHEEVLSGRQRRIVRTSVLFSCKASHVSVCNNKSRLRASPSVSLCEKTISQR